MFILTGHHLPIVFLAYTVAAVSAFSAFSLIERLHATKRTIWLFLGAGMLGLGICSMHYMAMAAHSIHAAYDIGRVIASYLISLSASFIAFMIVWLSKHTWGSILAGSTILGIGGTDALRRYRGVNWGDAALSPSIRRTHGCRRYS